MKNAPFVLDLHDPFAYFGVSLLLVSSSIVAMLIPTVRATKVNPANTLLEEEGIRIVRNTIYSRSGGVTLAIQES